MHNITSRNQLDEWRHFEDTIDEMDIEMQTLNDYYECLIECDIQNQSQCKKICRRILMWDNPNSIRLPATRRGRFFVK